MSEQTAGVTWPVADGTRVPYEIYTNQHVFDREQEKIFRGPLWNYVGLEAETPDAEDFKHQHFSVHDLAANHEHPGDPAYPPEGAG